MRRAQFRPAAAASTRSSRGAAPARSTAVPKISKRSFASTTSSAQTKNETKSHGAEKKNLRLFDKILVANRGEIACRVLKTARSLGIKTVAVFSEADKNALHVKLADEAYFLGPPPAQQSYLRSELLLQIAKKTGAQAIHPGYGFLSENAGFAEECEKQGITFIGPPPSAIRAMGSKSESKNIMEKAGVKCVPGYHGEDQNVDKLKQEADRIGYPVLIKAVMGGGGKGMRIVQKKEDFEAALASAKRESLSSFNDDNVLIEKYLETPRHIEVQVFADKQGNTVHLFERDCSVQRRHQKVIEEAPAPGVDFAFRNKIGGMAVNAAKAVGYVGAGTVEFIADATNPNNFYFMEMNTRLQVEHPITEMITKQDLVKWQLLVASGYDLPLSQDQIRIDGHAFEARIYAENPEKEFLPGTGRLIHLKIPRTDNHVRIDTGILQGDEISVYYDPMIAKLIVWDSDRQSALRRLRMALDHYEIVGAHTNINFLKRLASHSAFVDAKVETHFIQKYRSELAEAADPNIDTMIGLASLYQLLQSHRTYHSSLTRSNDKYSPWGTEAGYWTNSSKFDSTASTISLNYGGKSIPVKVSVNPHRVGEDPSFNLTINGKTSTVSGKFLHGDEMRAFINGQLVTASVVPNQDSLTVFANSSSASFEVPQPSYKKGGSDKGTLLAPMPGKVVKVLVNAGDSVKKGQPLIIMEAMKMELVINAPADGKVERVYFSEGDLVEEKKLLIKMEDPAASESTNKTSQNKEKPTPK